MVTFLFSLPGSLQGPGERVNKPAARRGTGQLLAGEPGLGSGFGLDFGLGWLRLRLSAGFRLGFLFSAGFQLSAWISAWILI